MPSSFGEVTLGERVRWDLGLIIIESEFTPIHNAGGTPNEAWPSWGTWAESYAVCREDYLDFYHRRHGRDEVPGSELLFSAYQRGENPADVVIPQRPDPRLLLREAIA